MKKLFFLLLIGFLFIFKGVAQVTGTYQIKGADTIKFWKQGGSVNPNSTELILMNSTKNIPGFLFNTGNGITQFKRGLVKINDTAYIIGVDTLRLIAPSPIAAGSNQQVQFNDGGITGANDKFVFDKTKATLVSGGNNNTINSGATKSLIVGESNTANGTYSLGLGNLNTIGNQSVVVGTNSDATGFSIAVGVDNKKTSSYSSTFGQGLINTYPNALVIGKFNDTTSWIGAAGSSNLDTLPVFSIGNGTNNSLRSNVFSVLHNGNVFLNIKNNSTLDSVLIVDQFGKIVQKKLTGSGGSLSSVGLSMPSGFAVANSPLTSSGIINVTTSLNGVVKASGGAFTAGQVSNSEITGVDWLKVTNTPTTITGYGISNAVRTDLTYNDPAWLTGLNWSKITSKPTTLSGYGVTDPVVLTTGSYANPSWVTSLAWSKITGTPTTTGGYGITNVVNSINGITGTVIMKNADSLMKLPIDTSVNRNNYVLTFDSTNRKWYLSQGGSGGGTFALLSDVAVSSPVNNQIPVYNSGTSKWTNTSATTSIIGEGANLYWTNARFDARFGTKTTDSLPEGTTNLYLTNARVRNLISGASPMAYSSSTGVISIQPATTSQNGYLSSTDWNTFNNKQSALTFSTGLTNSSGTITNNLSTGISGTQTQIGSTSSNGGMIYKASSNASTTTGADHSFNVGNSGNTTAMKILNNGNVIAGAGIAPYTDRGTKLLVAGGSFGIEGTTGQYAYFTKLNDNNPLELDFSVPGTAFRLGAGVGDFSHMGTGNIRIRRDNSTTSIRKVIIEPAINASNGNQLELYNMPGTGGTSGITTLNSGLYGSTGLPGPIHLSIRDVPALKIDTFRTVTLYNTPESTAFLDSILIRDNTTKQIKAKSISTLLVSDYESSPLDEVDYVYNLSIGAKTLYVSAEDAVNFNAPRGRLNFTGSVGLTFATQGDTRFQANDTLEFFGANRAIFSSDNAVNLRAGTLGKGLDINTSGTADYLAKYHGSYTNRSLVDKEYVDSTRSSILDSVATGAVRVTVATVDDMKDYNGTAKYVFVTDVVDGGAFYLDEISGDPADEEYIYEGVTGNWRREIEAQTLDFSGTGTLSAADSILTLSSGAFVKRRANGLGFLGNNQTWTGNNTFSGTHTITTVSTGDSSNLAASTAWVKRQLYGSGGSLTLAGLSDVTIASLANNHGLFYNNSTSEWENKATASVDLTGITDNNLVDWDAATSKFVALTKAQLKIDLLLSSVENTALSTWVGTSNITTLGTIGSGTWNATAIGTDKGGAPTGGTTGQVLTKNSGTNYDYSWADATGGGGSVTGTGTANQLAYWSGSSAITGSSALTYDGTNLVIPSPYSGDITKTKVVIKDTTNNKVYHQAFAAVDLTGITTGDIPQYDGAKFVKFTPNYYTPGGTDVAVADGGTGISSGTSGGVLYFSGSTTLASSSALTNNSIVLGGGAGSAPKVVAGIITDGTSKLTLGVAGTSVGSVDFKNATSGTITLAPTTGALGTVTLTMPAITGTLATLTGTETFTNKTLTSPVLTTPNLGTPSAVTLTNGTGLPISTGVSGLGAGIATFLATPSSANLRAALTDEVGAGAAYFVGGALGTPASGTLTNATGLPLTTGVTGVLPNANGGTNQSTYTAGDLLYASASNTLSKRTIGSTGDVLVVSGGVPTWQTPTTLTSGTYTPTYTGTSNVTSTTAYACTYTRIGDVVAVSGQVNITPTSTSGPITMLELTLPVATTLSNTYDLSGTASGYTGVSTEWSGYGRIIANSITNRAVIQLTITQAGGSGAFLFTFNFSYVVQ